MHRTLAWCSASSDCSVHWPVSICNQSDLNWLTKIKSNPSPSDMREVVTLSSTVMANDQSLLNHVPQRRALCAPANTPSSETPATQAITRQHIIIEHAATSQLRFDTPSASIHIAWRRMPSQQKLRQYSRTEYRHWNTQAKVGNTTPHSTIP